MVLHCGKKREMSAFIPIQKIWHSCCLLTVFPYSNHHRQIFGQCFWLSSTYPPDIRMNAQNVVLAGLWCGATNASLIKANHAEIGSAVHTWSGNTNPAWLDHVQSCVQNSLMDSMGASIVGNIREEVMYTLQRNTQSEVIGRCC
jgi:hypothetical protein